MNGQPLQQTPVPTWTLVRALGGVGTLCAFLIVLTWQLTLPTITAKKAIYLESAVFRVLPGAKKLRCLTLTNGKLLPTNRETTPPDLAIYAGYDDAGALVGFALTAHGPGFQDTLRLLYGYQPHSQELIGFEVLESRETPGLGDKIEKDPAFLENFTGLDVSEADGELLNPITLVPKGSKSEPGEIDGISGATISSRAVAAILAADTATRLPHLHQQYRAFGEWQP